MDAQGMAIVAKYDPGALFVRNKVQTRILRGRLILL